MMEGRRFLTVAEILAEYEGEEYDRTRIGRLYYGTWLEARSYCEEHLGYRREKMAREHRVIASLLGAIDPTLEVELRLLRQARNQADYDMDLSARNIDGILRTASLSSARILSRLDDLTKMGDGA